MSLRAGETHEELYSFGSWDKESDSVAYLKNILNQTGLFKIYNQVSGQLLFMKPGQERQRKADQDQQGMIIDLVLWPQHPLVLAGWDRGLIGIECKKSNVKVNHAFAQAYDYSLTVWKSPLGFRFMCEFFFLWPFRKMGGFAGSQMAQNKIGTLECVENSDGPHLKFYCGENKVLKIRLRDNNIEVGKLTFGDKTGSR
jgi:hypothetical protein